MKRPRPVRSGFFPFTLRTALALGGMFVGLGTIPQTRADQTDVSLLFVDKVQLFLQTTPTNSVLTTNPFSVTVCAVPPAVRQNGMFSGNREKPAPPKTVHNLTKDSSGQFVLLGGPFADVASLNALFPNGSYLFTLQTSTGSPTTYTNTVTISGDLYPNNPRIV